ncbi:diacylglycerol kinase 4-like isoform X2 [Salvia splendens]|uniref:diacylglycerol kinase 4-like isoform X2 n=1 Tax=Salvia splendens TaxID=180675 RepID=UPI001C251ED9|nr:diacylglycerol kinase 4-like isoform X2 [Salvia splendens]
MLNFLFNMVITVTLTKYYVCYEGMDAHVAYGFVHLHNEKPYLAEGPISNKMIYTMQQLSRFKIYHCIDHANQLTTRLSFFSRSLKNII